MDPKDIQFAPKLINDLLDVIRNAIIVIDSKHRIIFANSWTNKMFHTVKDALYNQDIKTIFMEEDREILAVNILKITKKEGELESEAMLRRLDGSSFPCLIATTHFLWDDGKEGMAFTIHDLTEIKAIEKSLKNSERTAFLGNLIRDISHQIRNPVMVLGGLAKRMASLDTDSGKSKAIIKETNRLETLLATLENFINLPNPAPEKINFLELRNNTEKFLLEITSKANYPLKCTCDKNISEKNIVIDSKLLLQAIQAVVLNSCESYEQNAGEKSIDLHFSLSTDLKFPYVITITDQGQGIPEENIPFVFNLFYSNKTNHVGMGLTFAQRIIDLQDGRMSIHSKQNQGTTTAIYLLDERRRTIRTTKLI